MKKQFNKIKFFTKNIIIKLILTLNKIFIPSKVGKLVSEIFLKDVIKKVQIVEHNGISMKFSVPNNLNLYRVESFSTKEPETLEWLDKIPEGSIFWDIGANVGLYSIYAALKKNCDVISFEPSVFNLEILARNLYMNNLQNKVLILPIALSDNLGPNMMRMTSTEWGGALSSFGKEINWKGEKIENIFEFKTFGINMDQVVSILNFSPPDFIKLDVDGIEHFILKNGTKVLSNVKSVIVEINHDFTEQAKESKEALNSAGLTLTKELHSEIFEESKFSNTFNQIWVRAKTN